MPFNYNPVFFPPTYFGPGYFDTPPAVPYCAGPTIGALVAAVAARLQDPGYVHWTAAELQRAVVEALQTWNVWTGFWKAQATVALPLNTPFVDLTTALAATRPCTTTNWDLVAAIQEALLEPVAAGGTWTGTPQFTLAQITAAIARRRDQFLRETGIVQTRSVQAVGASATGRVPLPACTLQVRRAAWRPDATFALLPITRVDDWSATTFAVAWRTPATPRAYSTAGTPPTTLQLLPPPNASGGLDLITIDAGEEILQTTATPLGIPNDYVWVIKYGVLADLLAQDGLALDMARSAYCESRWQQGVELARRNGIVLAVAITTTIGATTTTATARIGSVADADAYSPTWQLTAGRPQTVLLAGQTLLGVWPPAGGGATYAAEIDLVACVPIPADALAGVDLPLDLVDTILDLAQHAALVKEGPGQIEQALPLLERAARAAGIDLQLQQAAIPARRPLHGQQQQDTSTVPRRLPPVPVEVA